MTTHPEDPGAERARKRRQVNGRDVAYLETGTGPPLVLVHGLGLSGDVWWSVMLELARTGYRVIAPDTPGFGDTPGPRSGLPVDEGADWLVRFCSALDLKSPAWVGHSASCQWLVRLAATHPTYAAALVLAAPTGDGRRVARLPRQLGGLAVDSGRESLWLVRRALTDYLRRPLTTLGTWIQASRHDPLQDASRVTCPTLVVRGTEDPVVSLEFAERLAGAMPDAALASVPEGTHGVALDPIPFADLIGGFLRERYSGRPVA